jgi:hypothetical protein
MDIKLDHDAPDGMCVYAGCQFQAELEVGWLTSKGWCSAHVCQSHGAMIWGKTVPGHMSRDTFTTKPLGT